MRKLKIMVFWMASIAYLIAALGFVSGRMSENICERINVSIIDSVENRFVTNGDIMNVLLEDETNILGYPLETINTLKLEAVLSDNPFIKEAVLYKTVNGNLNVEIEQRKPVLRVINMQGESYYIDKEGFILPVSDKFTSRVLVANGYISEPFIYATTRSIFDVEVPGGRRNRVIYELFDMASYIAGSELWSAQIAQIYVDEKYEYELIPRVGAHIIYIGDGLDYQMKFRKLKAFYVYGLNNKGWNNYEKINLKYKNQIVCTKR